MSLHQNQEEIDGKIWAGDYFGPNGAIALAYKVSGDNRNLLMLASTLYSAFTHCVKQAMRLRITYVFRALWVMFKLNKTLSSILDSDLKSLSSSEKEVLMAILLVCRFAVPFNFFAYRKMAIKLGKGVMCESCECNSTALLVAARLSRLWFIKGRKEYRNFVLLAITFQHIQEHVGFKTVNRLARLVGDKKMVKYSASKAESKDVLVKSGM